jgi:predicted dehydrogenase
MAEVTDQPKKHARVILVGCGRQANRAIYPCVAAASDLFEVLATCDLVESLAQATARRVGAPRVYTDVNQAIAECQPDGAFVIGPPGMQEKVAAQVLEHGMPVFTEKPSAPTVAGARKLRDLARARSTWGQTGFMKRFNDAYRAARACLDRPEFGKPLFLEKHFYATNPTRQAGQSDEDLLWLLLIMQGTHAFDVARFFLGDIDRISAQARFGRDGTCAMSAQVSFTSGAMGTVQVNNLGGNGNARYLVDVMGDGRAHVRVDDMRRVTYHGGRWNPTPTSDSYQQGYFMDVHPLARRLWTLGHYGEVIAFGQAVVSGRDPEPPVPTLDDNLAALQACRAAWLSCFDGSKAIAPSTVEN